MLMEKACLGSNACIPLCLFITILLGACLQKRLYQAQNMFIEKKLLNKKFLTRKKCEFCLKNYYTKCVAVEMQQTIIGYLASSECHLFCCIFDKSEGKCFAILYRKNHA